MGAKAVYLQSWEGVTVECKSNDLVINNTLSTPSPHTLSFFTQNELKPNNGPTVSIADSGTTSHMTPSAQCLLVDFPVFNVTQATSPINVTLSYYSSMINVYEG